MRHKKIGKVYLVGAGPGDPELLTLKGKKCLGKADVIIYDYLSNPALLGYARDGAELISAAMNQSLIDQLLVDRAKKGKAVARLKGGDPFIFGRGGEEAEVLVKNNISFEVVPGVTAAAGLAYAGFPLTHRQFASTVSFITGHEDPTKRRSAIDWERISRTGSLVFYMGVENLPRIVAMLMKNGRQAQTPAALVAWVTRGRQKEVYGTLADIAQKARAAKIVAPALIVVGEVVALHKKLNWRKKLPLAGLTIMVTRSREQASRLAEKLYSLGAEVIEFPTIEIKPPKSFKSLDQAIAEIKKYQFLVFTSRNGVRAFFNRLAAKKLDSRLLQGLMIAVIGPGTAAELEQFGLRPDLQANCEYSQEGLLKAFRRLKVQGKNILLARAEQAREVLAAGLRRAGAKVDVITAYRTVKPRIKIKPFTRKIDWITFTSSSTVTNFMALFGRKKARQLLQGVKIASIGRITSATARSAGLKVDSEAKRSRIDGLVAAIMKGVKA